MLTIQERVYLIKSYGIGEVSYQYAIAKFHEKYPDVPITRCGLKKLIKKFDETGSVQVKKKLKKAYVEEDDAASALAMHSLRENPKLSLRKRAVEPCPDSHEFREDQCAAYNSVPFEGYIYEWEPHYDDDDSCALTCKGKPSSDEINEDYVFVVAKLADKVQDGTRCRPGSLDMCIDGKCQRVGCDLRIGSTKQVDECGVCGGDGSSCSRPLYHWTLTYTSLCSATCGGGYKMSHPVCQNRVTGDEVEEELCNDSQKPDSTVVECNVHNCPPKWYTGEWGPCSVSCGGGSKLRQVHCVEETNNTKIRVDDVKCGGHKPWFQEACNQMDCPTWLTTKWSGCSVSCGEGFQVREVECRDPSDKPSALCSLDTKPMAKKSCSTGIQCPFSVETSEELMPGLYHTQPLVQPYPPPPSPERLTGEQVVPSESTFIPDQWGPCSVTCGEGIRKRDVHCKIFLEFSRTIAKLPDKQCTGKKPIELEKCYMEPCSSERIGVDIKDEPYRSDNKVIPDSPVKSYSWKEQGYTPCSGSCLGGIQERIVNCVRDDTQEVTSPDMCLKKLKPDVVIRVCNDHVCPPKWKNSNFSPCSHSCGRGTQTREVNCIREVTRDGGNTVIIPKYLCPRPQPPDRQYCNVFDCPVRQKISESTRCSKNCGGNAKTEEVESKQVTPQKTPYRRYRFIADEWGPCSVTCGEGVRKRDVHCKIFLEFSRTIAKLPDKQCTGKKPVEEEKCYMEPCSSERIGVDIKDDPYRSDIKVVPGSPAKSYSWKEQGYTHCSATCLGGVQELIVNCVRDDTQKVTSPYMCPIELKPEVLMRTCNDHPCPPRWNYSDFSPCSQSCGIGIQTREVNCIHEVTQGGGNTVIVPNNMCPQPPPPDRQYCNVLDCPVRWKVYEWSRCSKSCGGGEKTRKVECKQVMAQNHSVDRPPTMCPSPKPATTKPCNTKSCIVESDKPHIDVSNSTFIQHDPKKKKISLKVGGAATVFLGTTIKIKCPVKRFNRTKIQWIKDKSSLPKTKKYKTSKKGALRVSNLTLRDSGLYTCIAGKSAASIHISVRPKPGEFPTSEEIQKQGFKPERVDLISDVNVNRDDGNPIFSDDHSHEQRPDGVRKKPTSRTRLFTPTLPSLRLDTNVEGTTERSSIDQTFSNSRGHRMIAFPDDQHPFPEFSNTLEDEEEEETTDENGNIVVLGKGTKENLRFEWKTSSWSKCSETCGGNGFQSRVIRCVVTLYNTTQRVDNNLCDDAGVAMPKTRRKCGFDECPEWTVYKWSACERSKCFSLHKATQRRIVKCEIGGNLTVDTSKCDADERPADKQECLNEKCVGKWKVGTWSECAAACEMQGVKYRILQCVWYGTKKSAGTACKDLIRPPVMKSCKGPPCSAEETVCKDHSMFCPNVKAMNMCKIMRYQEQCCQTCKG